MGTSKVTINGTSPFQGTDGELHPRYSSGGSEYGENFCHECGRNLDQRAKLHRAITLRPIFPLRSDPDVFTISAHFGKSRAEICPQTLYQLSIAKLAVQIARSNAPYGQPVKGSAKRESGTADCPPIIVGALKLLRQPRAAEQVPETRIGPHGIKSRFPVKPIKGRI